MKKILCLLLSVLMLCPLSALAEVSPLQSIAPTVSPVPHSGDQINLLWDIPFGITIEEFREKAAAASGFTFELDYEDDDPIPRAVKILDYQAEKGYKIGGYPIRSFNANFYQSDYDEDLGKYVYSPNQVDSLRLIYITWYLDLVAEPEYVTALFAGVVYSMQQKYGTPTDTFFYIKNQSGKRSDCNIDIPTTYVDLTNVMKAFENLEENIYLDVIFNNVYMSLRGRYREKSSSYGYTVSAFFLPTSIDVSENKGQLLYDYEDIADTRRVNGVGF